MKLSDVVIETATIDNDDEILELVYDPDPLNPRTDFDNLGHIVTWLNRHTIGDKNDFSTPEDFHKYVKENKNDIIKLNVYMFEHGNIALSTDPFNDKWDSGQIGYIYVTKDEVRKEYSVKHVTKKIIDKVNTVLKGEISTYNLYLNGEVYGYILSRKEVCSANYTHKIHLDSCYGYYYDSYNEFKKDMISELGEKWRTAKWQ